MAQGGITTRTYRRIEMGQLITVGCAAVCAFTSIRRFLEGFGQGLGVAEEAGSASSATALAENGGEPVDRFRTRKKRSPVPSSAPAKCAHT